MRRHGVAHKNYHWLCTAYLDTSSESPTWTPDILRGSEEGEHGNETTSSTTIQVRLQLTFILVGRPSGARALICGGVEYGTAHQVHIHIASDHVQTSQ